MQRKPDRIFQIGDYWLSRRKGRSAWYRTWYDEQARQTRRHSLETDDLEAAKIALADWVAAHGAITGHATDDISVGTVLLRYYTQHAQHLRSGQQAYYAVAILDTAFGDLLPREISLERQRRFIDDQRNANRSDGYIRRLLAILKAALNRAVREGDIPSSPYIMLLPESEPRDRIATPAEVAQLLTAARSEHLQRYLLLAIGTAARPEAILELTPAQCDLVDRFIQLNPRGRRQNKKRRPTVPMAAFLMPLLDDAIDDDETLVQYNGHPLKSIRTPWRRMIVRAPRWRGMQVVGKLVEPWGIEPQTSTMPL